MLEVAQERVLSQVCEPKPSGLTCVCGVSLLQVHLYLSSLHQQ